MIPPIVPFVVLLAFGAGFVGGSVLTWRRYCVNPYVFGQSDTALEFVGRVYRVVILGEVLFLALRVAWPGVEELAGSFAWLRSDITEVGGLMLLVIGAAIALLGQAAMGAAWRVGVPDGAPPVMVRDGLFAVSRNPVFLGMAAMLASLFLLAPTGLTLTLLAVGLVAFGTQARLEEAHLERQVGEPYTAYRPSVRRWL